MSLGELDAFRITRRPDYSKAQPARLRFHEEWLALNRRHMDGDVDATSQLMSWYQQGGDPERLPREETARSLPRSIEDSQRELNALRYANTNFLKTPLDEVWPEMANAVSQVDGQRLGDLSADRLREEAALLAADGQVKYGAQLQQLVDQIGTTKGGMMQVQGPDSDDYFYEVPMQQEAPQDEYTAWRQEQGLQRAGLEGMAISNNSGPDLSGASADGLSYQL